jgi:hypothetical protein
MYDKSLQKKSVKDLLMAGSESLYDKPVFTEKSRKVYSNIIEKIREERLGFIVCDQELREIEAIDRFTRILIRCGGGRCVCSAQDVKHFMTIITKSGIDYVRDVSLLAEGS